MVTERILTFDLVPMIGILLSDWTRRPSLCRSVRRLHRGSYFKNTH